MKIMKSLMIATSLAYFSLPQEALGRDQTCSDSKKMTQETEEQLSALST